MDSINSRTSQNNSESDAKLIPLDERVILHGVAASLSPESLEEFKQYLEKQYPEIKQHHKDRYFADRFTNYLPQEALGAALEYSKKFLIEKKPDIYESLASIRMKPSKGIPIDWNNREIAEYFL